MTEPSSRKPSGWNVQKPARPQNLSSRAAREIGVRILSGDIAPGENLPNETELADALGISRTATREAVKILTSKGMVEARPKIGTRVLPRDAWHLLDAELLTWEQDFATIPDRLLDLVALRQVLEPAAAALAAANRTPEDVEAILACYREMEESVGRPADYQAADAEFHNAIFRATHNAYFAALQALSRAGLRASLEITNPDRARNVASLPLHADVAEAIARGDVEAAREVMTRHIFDAAQRLRDNIAALRKPTPPPAASAADAPPRTQGEMP